MGDVQRHRPVTWPDAVGHGLVRASISVHYVVGIAFGALLVLTAVLSEPVRVAWRLPAQHTPALLACEAVILPTSVDFLSWHRMVRALAAAL